MTTLSEQHELQHQARCALTAWTSDAAAELAPLTGGLINATFVVQFAGEPRWVLQRLHPVFGAEVNFDIEAVTEALAAQGIATPRLVRTLAGAPFVTEAGRVWRMLTFMAGTAVAKLPSVDWARAGGSLVGRFHHALADFQYDYRFTRAGVHDTAAHVAKLRACLVHADRAALDRVANPWLPEARDLAARLLAAVDLRIDLDALPRRHVHGDLKISNLLFRTAPQLAGVCLVDLDTVAHGSLAFELGDAMRSWCNDLGEDAGQVRFSVPIFAAAMEGYFAEGAHPIAGAERESIVVGTERICLELAVRFCVDVFEDAYFGWDAARFASRREHNLVRARGQCALAAEVGAVRNQLLDIVRR